MKIAKIILRVLNIILNILAGLALAIGLLSVVWGLAWGNPKSALISVAISVLPLLVVLANKIYPSNKETHLNAVLGAAFTLACITSITSFLFKNIALGVFWFYAALVILGVVLLRAAVRLNRGLRNASPAIRHRCILLSVVVTLLISVPLAYFEIRSRQEFDTVWQAVDQVGQQITPYGAVEHVDNGRLPYLRKDGFFDAATDCSYAHRCPDVVREWYVLTDNSKIKTGQMVTSIFKSMGYTTGQFGGLGGTGTSGYKEQVNLTITVNSLGDLAPPYPAPEGKVWRFLMATAQLSGYHYAQTDTTLPKTYRSEFNDLTFDYANGWEIEESSSAGIDTIIIRSQEGKLGTQPSGEPKATSGEVIKLAISPCVGGRECTIDGVYDGVYKNSAWPHGDPIELDDGTLATEFFFQYQGEDATSYVIFFRDGKKYVATFNVAGADAQTLSSNESGSKVFYPLTRSFRFYK